MTRLSSTAALVFTPSSSQSKDVEVFSLAANDGTAASSAASVKLRINAAPTLAAPKDIKGASAGIPFAISFNLLSQAAKATDPNKDTIQYRIDSIASGSLLLNNAPVEPGALVAPGSTLSWTPPNTINGRTLAFSVSAFDGRLYSASRPLYFLTDGLPRLTTVTPILVSSGSSSISYTQLAAAANESGPPGLEIAFRVQSIANGFSLTVNDAPVVAGTLIHAGDTIQFVVPSAMRGKKDLMQIVAWNGSFASAKPVAVKIDIR